MYGGNFHFYVAIPILPIGWKRAVEKRRRKKKNLAAHSTVLRVKRHRQRNRVLSIRFSPPRLLNRQPPVDSTLPRRAVKFKASRFNEKSRNSEFSLAIGHFHTTFLWFFVKQIIMLNKEIISPFFQNKTKKFTSVKIVA